MAWLDTDFAVNMVIDRDAEFRAAVLRIGRRDAIVLEIIDLLRKAAREGGGGIEADLRAIVERHWPELTGCKIWLLGYDTSTTEFTITVAHASLPKSTPGNRLPQLRLVRDKAPVSDNPTPTHILSA